MSTPSDPQTLALPPVVLAVRSRTDAVLEVFLSELGGEVAGLDPAAGVLVDELRRLLAAGGKRVRPYEEPGKPRPPLPAQAALPAATTTR